MLHSLTTSTYGDYDAIPNGGVVVVSDHNGDEEDKLTQDSRSEVASSRTPRYRKLPVTALAKEPFTVKCSLSCAKNFVYYFVYAVINVIIGIPSLYGYAAVIFNHEVFTPHMNTLSKLVIFSSLIHQLVFTSCSSLSTFAIGTVQDAGLIFLSSMANRIANTILDRDNGTEDEVISTVLVLLSLGTATLGLVLIAMGHFRLAE